MLEHCRNCVEGSRAESKCSRVVQESSTRISAVKQRSGVTPEFQCRRNIVQESRIVQESSAAK